MLMKRNGGTWGIQSIKAENFHGDLINKHPGDNGDLNGSLDANTKLF